MSLTSHHKTEQLYYHTPKKYVLVYGKEEEAERLQKILAKYFSKNFPSYNLYYSEELDLPPISSKPKFMERAYNTDKSLTNNMRFGIIHLNFILKYMQQKPCILIFVLNTEGKRFNEYINDFMEIYKRNDAFIRKNRIKCLFVLYNTLQRSEEERNVIKNIFDIPNRNIVVCRTFNFDDCFKDIEQFIRNYSASFYQNKVLKYKDNLLIGNPDNLRFKEYYVRNLIKIAYMDLFLDEPKKALKYFDKSCKMSLELLRNYKHYCEQNIGVNDMEALPRFYYYIQKCEELKRIGNLTKNWVIFIKLREKEIAYFELFKSCYQHLGEFDGLDTWHLTPYIHFSELWKIDFWRIFLYFYYNNVKTQDLYPKINIFAVVKDLLSLCGEFFSNLNLPLQNETLETEPTSLGIILPNESQNLERAELSSINSKLLEQTAVFEQRRQNFERIESLVNKIIETNYDTKIARSVNIILLLKTDFTKALAESSAKSESFIVVDPCFRHYPYVYQKTLKTIQEGQGNLEYAIKEMVEFDNIDHQLIKDLMEDQEQPQINVDMSPRSFKLIRVFKDEEIDNFGRIHIQLELESKSPSLFDLVSEVELIFDLEQYNKRFMTPRIENNHLIVEGQLMNHNPELFSSIIWLKGINLILNDKIFLALGTDIAYHKRISKLKVNKRDILELGTDLTQSHYLNNEYFPVEFKVKPNLHNSEDYVISNGLLMLNVHNSKKLLKSVKLYNENPKQCRLENNAVIDENILENKESIEEHIEALVSKPGACENRLHPDLEQLNVDKTMANDRFVLFDTFESHEETIKNYYMKIKLSMDADLEIDWIVSFTVYTKDLKFIKEESVILKTRLKIRCAFFISKNQQMLQQDFIVKTNDKINDKKIQTNSDYYLNFYLKSNHDLITIEKFEFQPGDHTKILQLINSFEAVSIPFNEGTNIGTIFRVTEVLNSYNIGNLYIKWKRDESKYYTKTQFKDLLIVNTFDIPFALDVSCPQRAFIGQKICYRYTIKNTSQKPLKFFVTMNANNNIFVAGMTKNLVDLRSQESKKIATLIICNHVGVLNLPELDVFVADFKESYKIKSLKSIYVTYDCMEDLI